MQIKELRKALGITQKQFSEKFGNIPMRTIQAWEDEYRTPPKYINFMIEKIIELEKEKSE